MTDSATEGSVAEPGTAAPAGTPDAQQPAAGDGSTPQADNPFSGLSEGTRKWVETKGYKTPEDLAAAYMSAEQKLGSSVSVPKEDAPQEEWDKFYSRLPETMRPPETPDKYEFRRPDGLPEDLPYNSELANASKTWMHEAKVGPKQAQVIHDKFASWMAEQQQAAMQATAEAVEATHADLSKEWGPAESESFKQKHALADRAIKKLGLSDAFKKAGILLPDGALTDPQIAKAAYVIGESMFAEDTIGADPVAVGGNPFKRGPNGERNITAISQLVKSDPARAARLAKEAGENPRTWGIETRG